MTRPLVLAHRGASGYRPELTAGALRLAAAQGADGVEIDVLPTADGRLVVRHDVLLAASTDADAVLGAGARTDRLPWGELARLRARERFPSLRPASAAHDGEEPLLALPDAVAIAEETGLLLVVEIKDAAASAAAGLDPAPLVARDLAGARCPIVLESFEPEPLDALASLGHPVVLLVDDDERAPEVLADTGGLARFAGVSLATALVDPARTAVLHAAGLEVWTWTLRPENAFLPARHRLGTDAAGHGDWRAALSALLAAGVDAVFADHPDLAIALRDGTA